MTQPGTVTITPNLLRMLRTLLVSNVFMVVAIFCIAVGLIGVGNWTVVACVVVFALTAVLYIAAALRQRPRVVITREGFVFEKLIGREAHQWEEVEGPFAVIRIGLGKAVAYKLTAEYKARTGRKPTSMFSGFDAAVGGGALPCSARELAELLNEHKNRNKPGETRIKADA